MYVAGDDVSG